MPNRSKKAKAVPFNAADVANIAKANPYIQRLIDDASIRDNVGKAIDSTQSAFERLANGKAPAKALLDDKKLQHDLKTALEAVRDATTALTEAPKQRAKKGLSLGRKSDDRDARRRTRARRLGEAPLQGSGHAVRRRGGVPVHASTHSAAVSADGSGQRRVARAPATSRQSITEGAQVGAFGVFGD